MNLSFIPAANWQLWFSLLQIHIAATAVVLFAAGASRLISTRRVFMRDWLWRCTLIGVLSSLLIPWVHHILPSVGPELAIIPGTASKPAPSVASMNTISFPNVFVKGETGSPVSTSPENSRPDIGLSKPITAPAVSIQSADENPASEKASITKPSVSLNQSIGDQSRDPASHTDVLLVGIVLIWSVGLVYYAVRGLKGVLMCRRLVSAATAIDQSQHETTLILLRDALSLETLPPICTSRQAGSPAVIGMWRPQIILPETALRWMTSAQLSQVLLHEVAHVVRRDPVVNLLQLLVRALFWHHPLVHWLNRCLSQSREEVCDNFVLAHCSSVDYAETLLQMAERCPRLCPVNGLAMLSEVGSMETRVTGLLDSRRDLSTCWPLWRKLTTIVGVLLIPSLLGLVRVTEQEVQAVEPPPPVATKQPTAPKTETAVGTTEQKKAEPNTSKKPEQQSSNPVETGTGRISGRVLFDKDGLPAPQAKVTLLPPPPGGENVYIGRLPLREVAVDAEGKFTFDSLPPGRYRVWANSGRLTSRTGSRKGVVVTLQKGGEQPPPIELKLVNGIRVTANVMDKATGKLIPDATIELGWSDLVGDFHSRGETPVIVEPLTPERWFFEVWAPGYAKETRWLNLQNGQDAQAEFQLVPGGSLFGQVRDSAGSPVEGVGLSVRYKGDPFQLSWIETDSKGNYEIQHLPYQRAMEVGISGEDRESQTLSFQLKEPKQKLDFTVTARSFGGSVAGTIRDKDGRPIPDARISNHGSSSNDVRVATSDAQGRFKLDRMFTRSAGYEVIVRAEKFAPQRVQVTPGTADKPTEVAITLEPGHRIVGRVTDDAGAGIAGVQVYSADGNHPAPIGGSGTTDKSGRFEFNSLPADCPFTFYKDGFSQLENQRLPLDKNEIVEVKMVAAAVIKGKVLDSVTGKPIPVFNVRLAFSPHAAPNSSYGFLRSEWFSPGQEFQANSGKFQLSDLNHGITLQVMVDAKGYETAVNPKIVTARGDQAEEVTFTLDPFAPGTRRNYSGRLLDANGKPISGAEMRLIIDQDAPRKFPLNWYAIRSGQYSIQPNNIQFLKDTTNQEGHFEFTNVSKKGKVTIVWWGDKIPSGKVIGIEEQQASFDIKLSGTGRITGKINQQKYQNVSQIEVQPIDDFTETINLDVKPDQQDFAIENLPPGQYYVILRGPLERLNADFDGGMTRRNVGKQIKIVLDEGETETVDWK